MLLLLAWWPRAAAAAEIYQVRDSRLLQVGDGNRSYTVRLSCVAVDPAQEEEAITWLRQALPRRTRVNLRPMGESDGILLARVSRLPGGDDVASGLINAGLARAEACP